MLAFFGLPEHFLFPKSCYAGCIFFFNSSPVFSRVTIITIDCDGHQRLKYSHVSYCIAAYSGAVLPVGKNSRGVFSWVKKAAHAIRSARHRGGCMLSNEVFKCLKSALPPGGVRTIKTNKPRRQSR